MNKFSFIAFSLFYPLNLYTFEIILRQFKSRIIYIKLLSIFFSCLILSVHNKLSFDFTWHWNILKWSIFGLLPFAMPFYYAKNENVDCNSSQILFWRNFYIAPACEELFYRILLPQLSEKIVPLSISFSLAHAHPLLLPVNWRLENFILIIIQCLISFCFGMVSNAIKGKIAVEENNFWTWISLSAIHGLANYCGIPILPNSKKIPLRIFQLLLLLLSLYLIFKK